MTTTAAEAVPTTPAGTDDDTLDLEVELTDDDEKKKKKKKSSSGRRQKIEPPPVQDNPDSVAPTNVAEKGLSSGTPTRSRQTQSSNSVYARIRRRVFGAEQEPSSAYTGDLSGVRAACTASGVVHVLAAAVAWIFVPPSWTLTVDSNISLHALSGSGYTLNNTKIAEFDPQWTSRLANVAAAVYYFYISSCGWHWYSRGVLRRRSIGRWLLQMAILPVMLAYAAAIAGISDVLILASIEVVGLLSLYCIQLSETRLSVPEMRYLQDDTKNVGLAVSGPATGGMIIAEDPGVRSDLDMATTYVGMGGMALVWAQCLFALARGIHVAGSGLTIWTEVAAVAIAMGMSAIIVVNAYFQQKSISKWRSFAFGEKIAMYSGAILMFVFVGLEVDI